MHRPERSTILITVDLEDWFQVENFKNWIHFSTWDKQEYRFEANTNRLLDLFAEHHIEATFFILGWCAKQRPQLIKKIHGQGHEIASHGFQHALCNNLAEDDFRNDVHRAKCILEDITGTQVCGYRAPSFSITSTTMKILKATGYTYDSSYNSFDLNTRYGSINLSEMQKCDGMAYRDNNGLWELPISNLTVMKKNIPWGGGGYFRLYPFPLFRMGLNHILKKQKDYLFYIHPWEIDPEQPTVREASFFYKLRHYVNIKNNQAKLSKFFKTFGHCRFVSCRTYLDQMVVKEITG